MIGAYASIAGKRKRVLVSNDRLALLYEVVITPNRAMGNSIQDKRNNDTFSFLVANKNIRSEKGTIGPTESAQPVPTVNIFFTNIAISVSKELPSYSAAGFSPYFCASPN